MQSRPRAAKALVPIVDFYGGEDAWSTSALLHSEPLIERSRAHAWRIRPHRHSALAQIFWLSRGSGVGVFDAERHELTAPCMLVVPEYCVHEFQWREDCDGFAVSIASVLVHALRQEIGTQYDVISHATVIDASTEARYINSVFEQLQTEYVSEHPMKEFALDNLVRALAIWVARHTAKPAGSAEAASRASIHFARFEKLIEQHHKSNWNLARYASELGITPPHLNAICQKASGASALQMVHDRLLLAARRELAYTDKSIADVATSLGFSEPSYFTRFFRRKMQTTPKKYRQQSGTLAGQNNAKPEIAE